MFARFFYHIVKPLMLILCVCGNVEGFQAKSLQRAWSIIGLENILISFTKLVVLQWLQNLCNFCPGVSPGLEGLEGFHAPWDPL